MLITLSSCFLLFAASALLYQADDRRSAFQNIKASRELRHLMRAASGILLFVALWMLSSQQGLERGIPIWLGIFGAVFVAGLFLAAQKPNWHAPAATIAAGCGVMFGLGALL